jgi:hypothetical protein
MAGQNIALSPHDSEGDHGGSRLLGSRHGKVSFWHKLDPLLGGTFRGRQPRQFGTFLTQRRHRCIAANYPSFDHFVGACEQRGRHSEVKSLSRFEVDYQLECGVLFYGKVNRLGALENSSGVGP